MTTELREAVQILIKRMETHPDEFDTNPKGRFSWVTRMLVNPETVWAGVLTEAEMQALTQAYKATRYRLFHAQVMETLLNEDEAEDPFMEVQGSSLKPAKFPITAAQAAVANKLGIPVEDYAKVLATRRMASSGTP